MQLISPTVSLFRQRKEKALDYYGPYLRSCASRYDLFRGIIRAPTRRVGRNMIHVPQALTIVGNDIARKVQIAFGSERTVEFKGTNKHIARKQTELVNEQLEDCESFMRGIDFLTSADVYGHAFGQYGWNIVTRKGKRRVLETGLDGVQIEKIKDADFVDFNGPSWWNLDILDVLPEPGSKFLHPIHLPGAARWVLVRRFEDIQDIEMAAAVDVYSKSAVAELKALGGPHSLVTKNYQNRFNLYRGLWGEDVKRQLPGNTPVEVWDMIGYVPTEHAPDGAIFRLITIANDTVVLRNKPHPHMDGQIQVLDYTPMRDPHYFHGIGKIEPVQRLFYLANKYASRKADALDFNLDPPIFYNRNVTQLDDENLIMRANRLIGIDGDVSESNIRPFIPDLRGMQLATNEIESVWQMAQLATAMIEDTVIGAPSSDRQTKAEFLGRQENVLTRVLLEGKMLERGFIVKLASAFMNMNRQWLKFPHEVRRLGIKALVDPVTNESAVTETKIDFNDVNPSYEARPMGVSTFLGRTGKQVNLERILTVLGANPVALQTVAWMNLIPYAFQVFEFDNPEDFISKDVMPPVMKAIKAALDSGDVQLAKLLTRGLNDGKVDGGTENRGVESNDLDAGMGDLLQQLGNPAAGIA